MIVSRFAPAPTGLLHIGHVVNAIYVWGLARAADGVVLLRIEDHDRQRSRPEFERAILDDLEWLGFEADAPPVRQSDRVAIYAGALDRLRTAGLVYACECSRRDVERTAGGLGSDPASGQAALEAELRYPGTCASKHLRERHRLGTRIRLARSVETFEDVRHGRREQCAADQCGDLLARDREGNWTYQFAVTVDDHEQGVTLVIRGDDLLASTGRQIQLARLIGRETPPLFLHHALIMKTPAQKLSKADGDTSVRDLRASGHTPGQVIARAARLAGLCSAEEIAAGQAASLVGPRYEAALRRRR
ncbi:MAG: tRNA glutamyl-Q(34) synthetase GluQRS [Luteitalea sp.]|nr:tRNA glutamyl-Q(34) synthetase GluQRS [Luteitalea sp.]